MARSAEPSLAYLGPISAVRFSRDGSVIYAGSGANFQVYDVGTGKLLASETIFRGSRIHGIKEVASTSLVVIFGQKRVHLYSIQRNGALWGGMSLLASLPEANDWIFDVEFLPHDFVAQVFPSVHPDSRIVAVSYAHNQVRFFDFTTARLLHEIQCSIACMLYSSTLHFSSKYGTLVAVSGTIFNEVHLWLPLQSPSVLLKFLGHEGVIFRTVFSDDESTLVSVSDDRTARVWSGIDTLLSSFIQGAAQGPEVIVTECKTFFGHEARVWDCRLIKTDLDEGILVTASEDTTVGIWNTSTTKLIATLDGHIGKSVWRLDIDPSRRYLISGGNDSVVKMWNIARYVFGKVSSSPASIVKEFPVPNLLDPSDGYPAVRSLNVVDSDTLAVSLSDGSLRRINIASQENSEVYICPNVNYQTCAILEPSSSPIAILGDERGRIHIVSLTQPPAFEAFVFQAMKDRIAAIKPLSHPTSRNGFVVSSWSSSEFTWFSFDDGPCITALHKFVLPYKKGTAFSFASVEQLGRTVLAAGDSNGSIHLFELPEIDTVVVKKQRVDEVTSLPTRLDSSTQDLKVIESCFCFRNVHGRERTSALLFARNSSGVLTLSSGGRNGHICKFLLRRISDRDHSWELIRIADEKAYKNMEMVEELFLLPISNEVHYFGFYGVKAVLYNQDRRVKWFSTTYGGGKKPFNVHLNFGRGIEPSMIFAYYNGNEKKFRAHTVLIQKPEFEAPQTTQFHGREVNSLMIIHENIQSGPAFLTTSEDTTLRITQFKPPAASLVHIQTLTDHFACPRASAQSKWGTRDRILITGGGQLQLKCFRFDSQFASAFLIAEHLPDMKLAKKNLVDSNTRIMSLSSIPIPSNEGVHLIACGQSDTNVKLFLLNEDKKEVTHFLTLENRSPVLSIQVFVAHEQILVFAGGTNGIVNVWNVTASLKSFSSDSIFVDGFDPIHRIEKVHQSGVDAMIAIPASGDDICILTCGDDAALCYTRLRCGISDSMEDVDQFKVSTVNRWNILTKHCSSLRALATAGGYLFTSGPDQLVSIWRITDSHPHLEFVDDLIHEVSHCSAIDVAHSGDGFWIFVAGQGVQVLQWAPR